MNASQMLVILACAGLSSVVVAAWSFEHRARRRVRREQLAREAQERMDWETQVHTAVVMCDADLRPPVTMPARHVPRQWVSQMLMQQYLRTLSRLADRREEEERLRQEWSREISGEGPVEFRGLVVGDIPIRSVALIQAEMREAAVREALGRGGIFAGEQGWPG